MIRTVITRDGEILDVIECDDLVTVIVRNEEDDSKFINLTLHGSSESGGVEFNSIRLMWEYLTRSMYEFLASHDVNDPESVMKEFFGDCMLIKKVRTLERN
jgi:hypothetical protein